MSEDYEGARKARRSDLQVLEAGSREMASLHMGGIVVECQLKALLMAYHQISAWGEPSRRKRDPMTGQPVANPGHGLHTALRHMALLYKRAKTDPLMMYHLSRVMNPLGATEEDFIDIRYYSDLNVKGAIATWRRSFDYVCGWLDKNKRAI